MLLNNTATAAALQPIADKTPSGFELTPGFIVSSEKMRVVASLIEKVAPTSATVLICGPTGSGKELVARAIHKKSQRTTNPFVVVDCTTLAYDLAETELYGHERGAFTGAVNCREGLFEAANGGTAFIDEISELSLPHQAKLLRFLESKTVRRVGSTNNIKLDVRIVAATNRDLKQMAREGKFREDLYYRLNVINITVPPLVERQEDIPALIEYYMDQFGIDSVPDLSRRAMLCHNWPGNVRELKNMLERISVVGYEGFVLESAEVGEVTIRGDCMPTFPEALKIMKSNYARKLIERFPGASLNSLTKHADLGHHTFRRYFPSILTRD